MGDLLGIAIVGGLAWWGISAYIKKWKLNNPGKPVFERVEYSCDCSSYPEVPHSLLTPSPQDDKWLAPGGATSDYYSYHSQRDEDSRRWNES